jgi:hypothetical protein
VRERLGFIGCHPTDPSGGYGAAVTEYSVSLLREMIDLMPAMVRARRAIELPRDWRALSTPTTAFMQFIQADLFKDCRPCA